MIRAGEKGEGEGEGDWCKRMEYVHNPMETKEANANTNVHVNMLAFRPPVSSPPARGDGRGTPTCENAVGRHRAIARNEGGSRGQPPSTFQREAQEHLYSRGMSLSFCLFLVSLFVCWFVCLCLEACSRCARVVRGHESSVMPRRLFHRLTTATHTVGRSGRDDPHRRSPKGKQDKGLALSPRW